MNDTIIPSPLATAVIVHEGPNQLLVYGGVILPESIATAVIAHEGPSQIIIAGGDRPLAETVITHEGPSQTLVYGGVILPEEIATVAIAHEGPSQVLVPSGKQGLPGAAGPEGESAYQIWLGQGHTGSESDFLDWLRAGGGTKWYVYPYDPDDTVGQEGDLWWNTVTNDVYQRHNGTWY